MSCARCPEDGEYERGCAWCEREFDLCFEHRDVTFLCDLCFRTLRAYGKEEAQKRARARLRARVRRRRARWKREPWTYDPMQGDFWTEEMKGTNDA